MLVPVLLGVLSVAGFAMEDGLLPRLSPGTLSLKFDSKTSAFAVIGLEEATLKAICELSDRDKGRIFAVYPVWEKSEATTEAFPMLGRYVCEDGALSFHPGFPLEAGLRYQGRLRGRRSDSGEPFEMKIGIEIPRPGSVAGTTVVSVFPSGEEVPANLLKFYILFSEPMSLDQALDHIRLIDKEGHPLKRPFLEVQDELWDREHRRLTLFLDPGRIKRGLQPNLSEGPPLTDGQTLTLEIDRGWLDGAGRPLKSDYRKTYRVVRADRESPDPASWTWVVPPTGSVEPLILRFPEPLDYGLLRSGFAIVDDLQREVAGRIALGEEEREWHFYPTLPWREGGHGLQLNPRLEDLAGNNLRRLFDRDLRRQPGSKSTETATVVIPFDIVGAHR